MIYGQTHMQFYGQHRKVKMILLLDLGSKLFHQQGFNTACRRG